jgi:anaerobic selenocysteine-containing dehydrogenase
MTEIVAYRTCPLCEATCGLEITLENGCVAGIRGDKGDVFSKGYLCPKGAALGELHEDPDRLRSPLVKKNGRFETVSWDEAFQAVENGLKPVIEKYGKDAVAVYLGNPVVHTMSGTLYGRVFVKALGSRNVYSASTLDQMPKQVACGLMYGGAGIIPVPDLDRTDYLCVIGANPFASNGSLCTAPGFPDRLRAIKNRGRLVVIDPIRTRTAREADWHLPIRPGSDALLLLAMVNVLFAEGLADPGHLQDHINGLEEIETLAQDFTPEKVCTKCGLEADDIRTLARELAQAPTAAVYGRMGASTVRFGGLCSWLVDVVNILTGNLDKPGGAMFSNPAHARPNAKPGGKGFSIGRWATRVKGLSEVCSELPVAALCDEITTPGDGQIKALVTMAANPVLTMPNGARLDQALAGLDFMVSVDFYLNETTRQADVILPPPGPLAVGQYDFAFYGLSVRNVSKYSAPILPEPDRPDKWEILLKLSLIASGQGAGGDIAGFDDMVAAMMAGKECGLPDSPIFGSTPDDVLKALGDKRGPERLLDLMIRTGAYGDGFGKNPDGLSLDKLLKNPHGIDLGPLTPRIPEILKTQSAKIELAPPPLMEDVNRLRDFMNEKPSEYLMVGRRHLLSNNSWMHNLPTLMKGPDRCTLQLHPDDASKLGLKDGDSARIKTDAGQVVAPVEITGDLQPGVVSLPHGYGHNLDGIQMQVAESHPGINSNLLACEDAFDPLTGTSILNGIAVTIEPVDR